MYTKRRLQAPAMEDGSDHFSHMSSDHHSVRTDDQEVEKLFIGKNIPEIKQIEQKTRLAIERKKEELRQLVGERYHDMIEAADSVIQMKEDANNVKETLLSVQEQCREIQQTHLLKGTGGRQAPPTISTTQSVAAQMKLILDLQAKVWFNLERGDRLSTTLCFLLMRNGSSRMRTVETAAWPSIMTQFTQRIGGFKAAIIQSCRGYLRSPGLTADDEGSVVDALVSLLLLEGCGLDQVLTWFLEDRKEAIQVCFSRQAQSVKTAVKEVVSILHHAILFVSTSFCKKGSNSLIVDQLQKIVDSEKGYYHKYIPEDLVARLPDYNTFTATNQKLTISNLDSTCINTSVKTWLESCLLVTRASLKDVLVHVSSLKGLANIRNVVQELLSQPSKNNEDSSSSIQSAKGEWSCACQSVLNEDLSLYDKFVRQLLLARAKDVIEKQLKDSDVFMRNLLHQLVSHHRTHPDDFASDCHMTSFLWSTRDELELGGVAEGKNGMLKSLQMKSKGCSPQINHFCVSSSLKLQSLVEDLNHLLSPDESCSGRGIPDLFTSYQLATHEQQGRHQQDLYYPFDRLGDNPPLLKTVEELVSASINRFLVVIDEISAEITNELKETITIDQLHSPPLLDRLILIARLCQCVIDFTPNLKQLVSLQDGSPWQPNFSNSWKTTTTVSQTRGTTAVKSLKTVSLLQQKADQLLGIWCRHLAQCFLTRFRDQLFTESESSIMSSLTVWEETKITEESESGQEVSSRIRLPSQASVFIVTTLYALCQEIARVGGHCFNQAVLKDMTNIIFSGVTDVYLELYEQEEESSYNVNQQSSLQALFDYRFISSVLWWYPTSDKNTNRHSRLLDILLSHIDPFDYDVFSPHLANLLDRQLQRSTVMFGSLFSLKEQISFSSQTLGSSPSTEKHVILPLSVSLPRIPLLPGSTSKPTTSKSVDPANHDIFSIHSPSFFAVVTTLQHI